MEALWAELNALHAGLEPTLIRRIDPYPDPAAYLEILKDPNQAILLLEDADGLIGGAWIAARSHAGGQAIEMPVVFIQEICITAHRRRQGHGQALMREIEQWARARRVRVVEFNVWSRNEAALRFYEALGFRSVRHEMTRQLD